MKVLKGNEEFVITGKELAKHRDICRREGALEELYKLSYYCDKAQVDERTIKRMILKRIKELEGRKNDE